MSRCPRASRDGEKFVRRIGWVSVVLGTVVAFLVGRLLSLAVQWFYRIIAFDGGERGTFVLSSDSQTVALVVEILGVVVALALPLFLGGIVAGRLAGPHAGLNGALTAALGALGCAVWFLWSVLQLVLNTSIDPSLRSENLGLMSFWAIAFSISLPLALLVSYLGGRVGELLRNRNSAR
jgi:hypothetical protein